MIESLGLNSLYGANNLSKLIAIINSAYKTKEIDDSWVFREFILSLRDLQNHWKTLDRFILIPRNLTVLRGEDSLELEIIDYNGKGIEPDRFTFILDSFHKLHDAIVRILAEKDARLRIAFVDSGSNVLIAFVSKLKVIEFAKRFFSEYWRQIWFSPYQEFN